jgi:hypothetical protein
VGPYNALKKSLDETNFEVPPIHSMEWRWYLCISEYMEQLWHREKRGRNFGKATIYQRVPEYFLANEF